jgi:hypothetical protein
VFEYSNRDFFEPQTEAGVECLVAGSCWLGSLAFECSIRDFFEAQKAMDVKSESEAEQGFYENVWLRFSQPSELGLDPLVICAVL